jgi:hypothetical protein
VNILIQGFLKDEIRRQVINKVIEGRLYKQRKQNTLMVVKGLGFKINW